MISQTVCNFKVESTQTKLTSRGGLPFYIEFFKAMGLPGLIDKNMPKPLSNRGYDAEHYITSLSMMMYAGGEAVEHVRELKNDKGLASLFGDSLVIPSSSAIGKWLPRIAARGGIEALEEINKKLVRKAILKSGLTKVTVVWDPTHIKAQKRDAKMSYLGFKGYRPAVVCIKELDYVIAYEFKEGNDNGNRISTIKKALDFLPEGIEVECFMADSEACSGEVMQFLNNRGVKWIIAAGKNSAVKESISNILEHQWRQFVDRHGVKTKIQITEIVHILNTYSKPFRLIVQRTKQDDGSYFYHCIATSDNKSTAQKIVQRYRERSEAENDIKEVKNGFGMRKMPSGDFAANALYFGIGILAYNLFIAQRNLTMPEDFRVKTIKTVRWLLINIPGKIINHAGRLVIKLAMPEVVVEMIHEIRLKTYILHQGGT